MDDGILSVFKVGPITPKNLSLKFEVTVPPVTRR